MKLLRCAFAPANLLVIPGKRQEGGDTADHYFLRTECIAGVKDMRFQALMPDVLHWLGIQKIDRMMVRAF